MKTAEFIMHLNSLEINKGKLYVHYAHGRYGYWRYTFRFRNRDFELSNSGTVINHEISINYLTKKKIVKENTNESAESGEEVFKETITGIHVTKPVRLSEIKDFDALGVSGE